MIRQKPEGITKNETTVGRFLRSVNFLLIPLVAFAAPLSAQFQERGQEATPPKPDVETPVQATQPVTAVRTALGITYPEGETISIEFKGTDRHPRANGEAKVERKRGATEIEIELDEMKPATAFGGDIATYVMWIASPEGHVDNAGEFILEGNRSKLNVSTTQETFGMFITAEPHFLVRTPSRLVVMENVQPRDEVNGQMVKVSRIEYRGWDGLYSHIRESLADAKEGYGEIRTDVKQAQVSVRLARQAGAGHYVPEKLARAEEALEETMTAAELNLKPEELMLKGHQTVRLALEAQIEAEEAAFEEALEAERQEHAEEVSKLATAIGEARTEAERARLEAEQQELELEIEQQARETARQEAEQAQLEARQAWQEAQQARQQAQQAQQQKQEALQERQAALARMRAALNQVVETRMTARGLILNLPNILFEIDKATLKPAARETLAQICGILQVAPGHNLAIEGHTDSTGSYEYNQTLSWNRASSVRDYLGGCGLSPEIMTVQGFGESRPIASNETADGRQKNRRVEIVLEDQANQLSYIPQGGK